MKDRVGYCFESITWLPALFVSRRTGEPMDEKTWRPPPGNTSTQFLDTLVDSIDMDDDSVGWGKITVNSIFR